MSAAWRRPLTLWVGLSALSSLLAAACLGAAPVIAQTVSPTVTQTLQSADVNSLVWAGDTLTLHVTGGEVPADASAVVLNVTVTDTQLAPSYLTLYPTGEAMPATSNLNWDQGSTAANLAVVAVGSNGDVSIYDDAGATDVIVDLEGYFLAPSEGTGGSEYVPLTPARITDTRPGSGEPNASRTLGPGQSLQIQATGAGGVPSAGVSAVALNVTVTDTSEPGFLTAYPTGETRPLASNLNWVAGETVANSVIVPVGHGGEITVFNSSGDTDVVVDVNGYFTTDPSSSGTLFNPTSPIRVLDTRPGSGVEGSGSTLGPDSTLSLPIAGSQGIPSEATGLAANVTATDTTAGGYLTVYPTGPLPLASDLNWEEGATAANLALPALSSGGSLSFYNAFGQTDVVMDVFGWFEPAALAQGGAYFPLSPTRILDTRSTPILQAHAGSYLTLNQGGSYPGAALLEQDLAFSTNAALISQCDLDWSDGISCGVDGVPGQCTFWAELNWDGAGEGGPSATGPGATGLVGNGDDVAKSAIQRGYASAGTMATLAVGDLVSWPPGEGQYDVVAGHTAVVIYVDQGTGIYVVSEMNYTESDWQIDYRVVGTNNPDVPTIAVPLSAS